MLSLMRSRVRVEIKRLFRSVKAPLFSHLVGVRLARHLQGVGLNQKCVTIVSQSLQMTYWLRSRASFFAKHYSDITHCTVCFLISSATMIRFDCFHIGVGLRGSCVLIDDVLVCAVGQVYVHIKHCTLRRPLFSHSWFFDSSALLLLVSKRSWLILG